MRRDQRGAELAVCKIAGLRLPRFESWSCHTPSDLLKRGFCAPAHAAQPGRVSLRFRSAGRGADADRASRARCWRAWPRSGRRVGEQDRAFAGTTMDGRGDGSAGMGRRAPGGVGATARPDLVHRAEGTARLWVAAHAGGVPMVLLVCSCPGGNTPETTGRQHRPWWWSFLRCGRLTETPTSVPLHWLDLPVGCGNPFMQLAGTRAGDHRAGHVGAPDLGELGERRQDRRVDLGPPARAPDADDAGCNASRRFVGPGPDAHVPRSAASPGTRRGPCRQALRERVGVRAWTGASTISAPSERKLSSKAR